MEIDTISPSLESRVTQDKVRETPPPPPRPEPEEPSAQPNRPTPPRRAQNLINTVTQSLEQAGIASAGPNALPAVNEAKASESDNNLEKSQSERVSQALQAFMHSLVQALNSEKPESIASPAVRESVAQPSASVETQVSAVPAADAYGGLVSRLEGLVRQIEGAKNASPPSEDLVKLNAAFKELASTTATVSSEEKASAANLQTVLKNMVRNLESTGDPTLASTGNVINTAA